MIDSKIKLRLLVCKQCNGGILILDPMNIVGEGTTGGCLVCGDANMSVLLTMEGSVIVGAALDSYIVVYNIPGTITVKE